MSDDLIRPISIPKTAPKTVPSGRPADRVASYVAGLGAILSLIAAIWFFLGFAENDTRLEHLTSAFVLTGILFSFAIGPFAIVAAIGRRAYKTAGSRRIFFWVLFLMLPWVGLGTLTSTHTPLPKWSGTLIMGFAALLSLWAIISLALVWREKSELENPNFQLKHAESDAPV